MYLLYVLLIFISFGGKPRPVEVASNNKFMFYSGRGQKVDPKWRPPQHDEMMTFDDWIRKADEREAGLASPDEPFYYFYSNGFEAQPSQGDAFIVRDLPFLTPHPGPFMAPDVSGHAGINCRFGMNG
jgi:hypothetical protein